MQYLNEQLQSLQGRIGLMCIGNIDCGDDAFGIRLGKVLTTQGEASATQGVEDVIIAGTEPEKYLSRSKIGDFDHLIFVDAVDFGAVPGSVVFLNSTEMASRFPQVSTHRLSLGLLARMVETRGTTKAWLLGVQPQSLRPGRELSSSVQTTMAVLIKLLMSRLNAGVAVC